MRTAARHLAAPCAAIDELASSSRVQSDTDSDSKRRTIGRRLPCRLPPVDVADFVAGRVVAVIQVLQADAGPAS